MITKSKLDKLKQPSSWAGIAVLLSLFHPMAPEDMATIINTGTAIAASAAIFINEKGQK